MLVNKHAVVADQVAAPGRPRLLTEVALSGVYEISKILAQPARLETTLSNVLNLLSSFLDMQHGTILLLDDEDIPDIVVGTCWSEAMTADSAPNLPRAALDQIVATAMPLIVQNIAKHAHFADSRPRAELGDEAIAFIGVPIKIGGKVVGTLSIDRAVQGSSTFSFDHDVRFLAMIANLIGQTIHLQRVISRDRERLMEESRRLEKALTVAKPAPGRVHVAGIIGNSPGIRSLLEKIAIVAKSNATVLLRGESGTGKELFARAIHELSSRSNGPFVKVNCAALPESVLESELFGHEKGAFTGAINSRKGRFELADRGTIFLDEIGEISGAFQAKLLRVLQEGEFDRVGSTRTQKVDVRVVAATNRDLLKRFNKENGRDVRLTEGALGVLKSCYFPGNVRELENCIYRTATLAKGPNIEAQDFGCGNGECLSATLWKARSHPAPKGPNGITLPTRAQPPNPTRVPADDGQAPDIAVKPCTCGASVPGGEGCVTPEECEPPGMLVARDRLVEAMERSGWVQAKAARILGLTPRQIGYALKKHNVELKRF